MSATPRPVSGAPRFPIAHASSEDPGVPCTLGAKLLYSRSATEPGLPAETAARHSGDSTLMGEGLLEVLKRSPWYEKKKNSLSLTTCPPSVPPNWLKRSGDLVAPDWFVKKSVASSASLRTNSHRLPWKLFVPGLVTRFVVEPALLPYCADMFSVSCWNSCTVSSTGWLTKPPLRPLFDTPLSRKPLKFSRSPLTTVLAPFSDITPRTFTAPGVICTRSYTLRPFKGRFWICWLLTTFASLESSVSTGRTTSVTSTVWLASPTVSLMSARVFVPAFTT